MIVTNHFYNMKIIISEIKNVLQIFTTVQHLFSKIIKIVDNFLLIFIRF